MIKIKRINLAVYFIFIRKTKNYFKLKNCELGENLICKYKSKNLVENNLNLINLFEKELYKTILKKQNNVSNIN